MAWKARKFAKPSIMTWDGNKISDHNRSEVGIGVNRIEESARMANGGLRKYVIADKRTFRVSWKDLPHSMDFTVDGYWGKREIEAWYDTMVGPFQLTLYFGDGETKSYNVMMTNYGADISKRGAYDFWSVQVEMEEV